MKTIEVWAFLNSVKQDTVRHLQECDWKSVKEECDDLFRQATNNRWEICPTWWIVL